MHPLLVTAAVLVHRGKILLSRRRENAPYPLLWEFPGGKVESGEDPHDCIIREMREELAIDVKVEGIYEVVYYRYPERAVLVLAYRCQWLSGEIADLEVHEHCWVEPQELLQYDLLPADIPLAERIVREFPLSDTACL
jgi:8-oxo-dGTP diphosphatase